MDDFAESLISRFISRLKGFPRIEKKGKHPRFPRDAVVTWMRENWELL